MTLQVSNPWDGSTVAELPFDSADQIDRKLSQAQAVQRSWANEPLARRAQRVREALVYFHDNADAVAADLTRQMGKPITQSRREVQTMLARAEQAMGDAPEALRPDTPPAEDGFVLRIEHAPKGVVFDIAAWNYPLLIPINVIAPALLAGNTVLIKHSARTPLCGRHLSEAFGDLIQDLILTHDQAIDLIADERIAHVSFTGSVEGGRRIHQAVGNRFIDAGLELGGKDPAYVAADADLDFAVENIVDGACYNAGQSCCAVERVYVHESLYDAFLDGAQAVLAAYVLGDPMDEQTTMGPMANASALDELENQVDEAVLRGAKLRCGGRRGDGQFFPPTLLADVPNDAVVMQEESFGPIVPVAKVKNDDDALERMNDTRFGLTASVWTADADRAERFARALDAGTIFQNRCDYLEPSLPWTGCRDSGKGSTLSRFGFYHLTKRKAIHFRIRID